MRAWLTRSIVKSMSDQGAENPPQDGLRAKRARQLFGHTSGAKPWEEPTSAAGSTAAPEPTERALPSSSAPYPKTASYAPREVEQSDKPSIIGDVDDDGELTLLHPNYKLLMRISAVISALILMVAAIAAEGFLHGEFSLPYGILMVPAALLALFLIIRMPNARYNARGYQISRDRLRVVRGIMWRSDTIVPFGRVQHIDVDQGPIERALDIATLTLHTAGSHNASVHVPGLGHDLAVQMREEIRAHIKRESL